MKNQGYVKELLVKLEDSELLNVSDIFLKDIEKNFKLFQDEHAQNNTILKKYIGSVDYIFEPEKLSKKSPLTIIDAPWGTGKTFFIENFLKQFIDEKIKSDVFKKMIIIDAWKFSNSRDVPLEFTEELTKKLIMAHVKSADEKTSNGIVKKMVKWIVPASVSWQVGMGVFSVGATHNLTTAEEDKIKRAWNDISENKVPTIIFVDNLERLGSLSWDLLKAILKLQEFKNYLIVLPLNLKKLKNNVKTDDGEYPVEKYVDFNFYSFKQDYSNYFRKHYNNEIFLEKLNIIFNNEIDGEKLSIREVEQSFKANDILSIKDEYDILRKIQAKIWNPEEILVNIFLEDIKIFLQNERLRMEVYKKIASELIKKDSQGKYINIPKSEIETSDDEIVSKGDGKRYFYQMNFNYLDLYKTWQTNINKRKLELESEIKSFQKEISISSGKIETLNKKITELQVEIEDLKSKTLIESLKQEDYNSAKEQSLTEQRKLSEKKIEDLNSEISQLNTKIQNNNTFIQNNQGIIIALYGGINNEISRLQKIDSEDKLSKKQKDEIKIILSTNIKDINSEFENNSNFDISAHGCAAHMLK